MSAAPAIPDALAAAAAALLADPAIRAVQLRRHTAELSTLTTWPPAVDLAGLPVVAVPVAAGPAAVPLGELRVFLAPDREVPHLLVTQLRAAALLIAALLAAQSDLRDAQEHAAIALQIAERDELTGLGNRRAWLRALHAETVRCRRRPAPAAVLAVDLDRLKQANDTGGHAHGDELLRRTGEVLREQSRASDTACRLGGDEFALLAPETGATSAEALASRLRTALRQAGVAASLGVAVSPDGTELTSAWAAADGLMYTDKARRRGEAPVPLV